MRRVKGLDMRKAAQALHRGGGELHFSGILINGHFAIGFLSSRQRMRPVRMRHLKGGH